MISRLRVGGGMCRGIKEGHLDYVGFKAGLARGLGLQIGGPECKATITMWMIMELRHDSE